MEYKADLSGALKIWHPKLSARDVEVAIGKRAKIKHSVGELRPLGDKKPFQRTYCYFVLSAQKKTTLERLIKLAATLEEKRQFFTWLKRNRGRADLCVGVESADWLQLHLSHESISFLSRLKIELVLEN